MKKNSFSYEIENKYIFLFYGSKTEKVLKKTKILMMKILLNKQSDNSQ